MLLSKYTAWGSKKSKFIEDQKASGLGSSLGIKTFLYQIPLLVNLLF